MPGVDCISSESFGCSTWSEQQQRRTKRAGAQSKANSEAVAVRTCQSNFKYDVVLLFVCFAYALAVCLLQPQTG